MANPEYFKYTEYFKYHFCSFFFKAIINSAYNLTITSESRITMNFPLMEQFRPSYFA